MNKPVIIGITIGDPSGIGPEVAVKALSRLGNTLPVNFVIIGNSFVLDKYKANLSRIKRISLVDINNVVRRNFKFGKILPAYGRASLEYIDKAVELIKRGEIQALVTAPVSKEAISASGEDFSGHTEYLASRFKVRNFIMMMLAGNLKVVPLTRHIRISNITKMLNSSLIYSSIKTTRDALREKFRIKYPRIAVCSLNPHGGEGGHIGSEEKDLIIPAIRKISREGGAEISGPLSADGLFAHYRKLKFDCIIGMYHDQVLIPVKMADSRRVVNLTLGLPFIRTSCGHGTAFDIAGYNKASPRSMIEAIKLAYELTKNSLKKR